MRSPHHMECMECERWNGLRPRTSPFEQEMNGTLANMAYTHSSQYETDTLADQTSLCECESTFSHHPMDGSQSCASLTRW
jgi:hypothetical protein